MGLVDACLTFRFLGGKREVTSALMNWPAYLPMF